MHDVGGVCVGDISQVAEHPQQADVGQATEVDAASERVEH